SGSRRGAGSFMGRSNAGGDGGVEDAEEARAAAQRGEKLLVGAAEPGLRAERADRVGERGTARAVEMRDHLVEQQHRRPTALGAERARAGGANARTHALAPPPPSSAPGGRPRPAPSARALASTIDSTSAFCSPVEPSAAARPPRSAKRTSRSERCGPWGAPPGAASRGCGARSV